MLPGPCLILLSAVFSSLGPLSTTAQAAAISVWEGGEVTRVEARTNARVEAMAMVRTMKKMATARHEAEHQPRSLVKFWKLPARPPPDPTLTEVRVERLGVRLPDICFN